MYAPTTAYTVINADGVRVDMLEFDLPLDGYDLRTRAHPASRALPGADLGIENACDDSRRSVTVICHMRKKIDYRTLELASYTLMGVEVRPLYYTKSGDTPGGFVDDRFIKGAACFYDANYYIRFFASANADVFPPFASNTVSFEINPALTRPAPEDARRVLDDYFWRMALDAVKGILARQEAAEVAEIET